MKKLLPLLALSLLSLPALAQDNTPKSGDSIAFLGDSITDMGAKQPGGYVNLVVAGFKANGISVKPRPAGISGNTAAQMLARVDKIIGEKPTWMTISAGVNDSNKEVTVEDYGKTITAIVDKAQAANIKVLIMTASLLGESPDKPKPTLVRAYNDWLHKFAAERHLPVAEVNADMQVAVTAIPHTGDLLVYDGVHPNPAGHLVMAEAVIRGFGLTDDQIAKAKEAWLDLPSSASLPVTIPLTLREYQQLQAVAFAQKKTVQSMVDTAAQQSARGLLPAGSAPSPTP